MPRVLTCNVPHDMRQALADCAANGPTDLAVQRLADEGEAGPAQRIATRLIAGFLDGEAVPAELSDLERSLLTDAAAGQILASWFGPEVTHQICNGFANERRDDLLAVAVAASRLAPFAAVLDELVDFGPLSIWHADEAEPGLPAVPWGDDEGAFQFAVSRRAGGLNALASWAEATCAALGVRLRPMTKVRALAIEELSRKRERAPA